MQRFDVYGFRDGDLETAVSFIEQALGIQMVLRDSSYRGIYYCAGDSTGIDYRLQSNGEQARWHREYPEFGATLMVNNVADMDAIREKLTAGRDDPKFLRSIVHPNEPEDDDDTDD